MMRQNDALATAAESLRSVLYGGGWMPEQRLSEHPAQLVPALYECAAHVAAGSFEAADRCLRQIKKLAAAIDGPLQRLAVIMANALVRRLLRPIQGVTDALIPPLYYFDWESVRRARRSFFELSPLIMVGFIAANRAIVDAMENEKFVHVIDLSGPAAHPWQWLKLLHDFRGRPDGPPHLRITVVHDDKDFLAAMSELLSKEAEALSMPLKFHGVLAGRLEAMDPATLCATLAIQFGEARAISCALQMHRLLAVDDTRSNLGIAQLQQMANVAQLQQMAAVPANAAVQRYAQDMAKMNLHHSPASILSFLSPQTPSPPCQPPKLLATFLSAVRALSPTVMLVLEQDASHNFLPFCESFGEALRYYAALFDVMDRAAAARQKPGERAMVERMLLAEEITDILVCEGAERHERLHQWAARMEAAGFGNVPISFMAIMEGTGLLSSNGVQGYQIKEHGGCLLLHWGATPLYSVSAWRPNNGAASGAGSMRQWRGKW